MHKHIDLNNFAEGALLERVNLEIGKVLENIQDLNTDATKKSKVTITIELEPNDRRELANVVSSVKSTLVPTTAVSASLMIGHDGKQVIGRELKSAMPGQYMVDVDSGEIVNDDGDKYLIHVESPTTVHLYGRLNDQGRRSRYVTSEALLPQYPFERFLDMEQMNIKLQSIFVKNENRDILLKVCGSVVEENIQTREDDGVSQIISAKTGVATIGKVAVPNPVTLAPYRTFVEVEQVESQFIFRMKEGPTAALFEADGGQWRNAAIENIKEFLADKLSEDVENDHILII